MTFKELLARIFIFLGKDADINSKMIKLAENLRPMKRLLALTLFLALFLPSFAADVLEVRETRVPVLIERQDNEVFLLRITPSEVRSLDRITLTFGEGVNLKAIRRVKLYYGGTDTRTYNRSSAFAPTEYMTAFDPGKTLSADPSYSMLLFRTRKIRRALVLEASKPLFPGVNYFWVSVEMKRRKARLSDGFTVQVTSAEADGKPLEVKTVSPEGIVHRMGVGVRHAGDDGVAAYRIPGLVTSRRGTLVATYDIRHNHSRDLQDYIDIGVSRSTDGGRTWKKMRKAVAMGEAKGLPLAQNGAGDAAILSDDVNGNLWIATIWAHGMGRTASWWSTTPGLDPEHTAQLVVSCSRDDGLTWSVPRSITPQLKDSAWAFFFDGPGRGITTSDGKLVFASQYTDFDAGRTPHAGIIYSEDRGETWHIHTAAKDSTTEAQVAELPDGALMLNMRDNRGGARSVAVTRDMGRTWEEHPSSRSALREPVCMASLISVRAADNVLGRDILLFSNPDDTRARRNITIKASLDGGLTWNEGVLLDERDGWGYSCLTMIDERTVGILYESSVANMTFQAIPLTDIVTE